MIGGVPMPEASGERGSSSGGVECADQPLDRTARTSFLEIKQTSDIYLPV